MTVFDKSIFDGEKQAKVRYRCKRCYKQGRYNLWIFGIHLPDHTEYTVCKHCGCVESEGLNPGDDGYKELKHIALSSDKWIDLIIKQGQDRKSVV